MTALVLQRHDRRYLTVGWFWFLGTFTPMIGIVTVGEQAMADRFAYMPCIGLFVAVVWLLTAAASDSRIPSAWFLAAATLVLLALGCLTYRQLGYWRDDETLWRYTLSVTQRNYMAHDNLAIALAKQGRSDEAVVEFRAANALHTYPPLQVSALATYELRAGHPQEAIEEWNSVLHAASDPNLEASAWSGLGQARLQLQQYDQAAANFQNALRLSPGDGIAPGRFRIAGPAPGTFRHGSHPVRPRCEGGPQRRELALAGTGSTPVTSRGRSECSRSGSPEISQT